jgi:hypothetical protein
MRGSAGYVLGAIALVLAGGVCLAASRLDRQIARAQQSLAAFKDDEPDVAFETVEGYLEYTSHVPWIASGPLNDVRVRRAALLYWRRQYDRIARLNADPLRAVAPDNGDLQLIVANAVYRAGRARATDRPTALVAIDAAINAYLTVLKNPGRHETAAYNYEYLARLREDIDKGRRAPEATETAENGPAGRKGNPSPQDSSGRKFKIVIPLEPGEMDKAIDPGKGERIERKG